MTLVLTGPGSVLQARLRRYRREHGNLPSPDEARFTVSPDVWAALFDGRHHFFLFVLGPFLRRVWSSHEGGFLALGVACAHEHQFVVRCGHGDSGDGSGRKGVPGLGSGQDGV